MPRSRFLHTLLAGVLLRRLPSGLILFALTASAASLAAQAVQPSQAAPTSPQLAGCDPDKFGFPLEVLTDTTGMDLRQYLFSVVRKIRMRLNNYGLK